MAGPAPRRRTWCLYCSGYIKRERGASEYCSSACTLAGANRKRALNAVARRAQIERDEYGTRAEAAAAEPEKVPLSLVEHWLTAAARL